MAGLFGWGARRPADPPEPARPPETSATSVVLPRFLTAVAQRASPVLLDLGPAIGTNVTFFGERLACKLLIGDLQHDLADRPAAVEDLRAAVMARLERTVSCALDGILCWDAFDYFDRGTAQAVAEFLATKLTPGGVVHGFFATAPADLDTYTRYVLQSPSAMTCRHESVVTRKRGVFTTRDLTTMFTGTAVSESVLLKNQRREILLKRA